MNSLLKTDEALDRKLYIATRQCLSKQETISNAILSFWLREEMIKDGESVGPHPLMETRDATYNKLLPNHIWSPIKGGDYEGMERIHVHEGGVVEDYMDQTKNVLVGLAMMDVSPNRVAPVGIFVNVEEAKLTLHVMHTPFVLAEAEMFRSAGKSISEMEVMSSTGGDPVEFNTKLNQMRCAYYRGVRSRRAPSEGTVGMLQRPNERICMKRNGICPFGALRSATTLEYGDMTHLFANYKMDEKGVLGSLIHCCLKQKRRVSLETIFHQSSLREPPRGAIHSDAPKLKMDAYKHNQMLLQVAQILMFLGENEAIDRCPRENLDPATACDVLNTTIARLSLEHVLEDERQAECLVRGSSDWQWRTPIRVSEILDATPFETRYHPQAHSYIDDDEMGSDGFFFSVLKAASRGAVSMDDLKALECDLNQTTKMAMANSIKEVVCNVRRKNQWPHDKFVLSMGNWETKTELSREAALITNHFLVNERSIVEIDHDVFVRIHIQNNITRVLVLRSEHGYVIDRIDSGEHTEMSMYDDGHERATVLPQPFKTNATPFNELKRKNITASEMTQTIKFDRVLHYFEGERLRLLSNKTHR